MVQLVSKLTKIRDILYHYIIWTTNKKTQKFAAIDLVIPEHLEKD